MDPIDKSINQANGRLRAARFSMQIMRRGSWLSLRGTFPPKPGKGDRPSQQILSPKIAANTEGVKLIEALARKVRVEIDSGKFSWDEYSRKTTEESLPAIAPPPGPKTIPQWIEDFEDFYFSSRKRSPQTGLTWEKDYLCSFRKLKGEVLSKEVILEAIRETEPGSKTRRRVCMAFNAIAKFAEIEIDVNLLKGDYSPSKVNPRTLPDDNEIASFWAKISDEKLRWIYGILATYGLRPHEILYLNFSEMPILNLLGGKTGPRKIWPCYPEWCDQWQLNQFFSLEIKGRNNSVKTAKLDKKFAEIIPFHLYDLRHSWARRTLEFGWPHALAAQQMGHSLTMHNQTYHAWIGDAIHQKIFEELSKKRDLNS